MTPAKKEMKSASTQKFIAEINERKRLKHIQIRYINLKREMRDIIEEYGNMFQGEDLTLDKILNGTGTMGPDPKA